MWQHAAQPFSSIFPAEIALESASYFTSLYHLHSKNNTITVWLQPLRQHLKLLPLQLFSPSSTPKILCLFTSSKKVNCINNRSVCCLLVYHYYAFQEAYSCACILISNFHLKMIHGCECACVYKGS